MRAGRWRRTAERFPDIGGCGCCPRVSGSSQRLCISPAPNRVIGAFFGPVAADEEPERLPRELPPDTPS